MAPKRQFGSNSENAFLAEKSEQYFAVMRSVDDPQAFDVMPCRNAHAAVTCARALRRMEYIGQMKFSKEQSEDSADSYRHMEADGARGFKLAKGAEALSDSQAALLYQLVGIETDILVTDVSGEAIRGYVRLSHRPTETGLCEIWLDAFSDEASALAPVVDEIDASGRESILIEPLHMSLN